MISQAAYNTVLGALEELKNGGRIESMDFINRNKSTVFEVVRALAENNAVEELKTFCSVLNITEITSNDKVIYQEL